MTFTCVDSQAWQDDLLTDAESLFLLKKRGHMDRWSYASPNFPGDPVDGEGLWKKHEQANTISKEESPLINENLRLFSRFWGTFSEFLDFGPGSVRAFELQALPLLQAFGVRVYRPIDTCDGFLDEIKEYTTINFPALIVSPDHKDFLKDAINPAKKAACVYWGGGGFGNFGFSDPSEIPHEVRSRLKRLKELLPYGGSALITLDTCQDGKKLEHQYNEPESAAFSLNITQRIKRDTPIDFDPNKFSYKAVWNDDSNLIEHRIIATQDQAIHLSHETVNVKKGDYFVVNHSYKPTAESVVSQSRKVGWRTAEIIGPKNQTRMLMLGT